MKRLFVILIAAFALGTGCSVTHNATFSPDSTRLQLRLDDMEYLGECEISIEYRTYMGIIRCIDTINGISYKGDAMHFASLRGNWLASETSLYPLLSRAAYKAVEEYPDATYFMVVRQTRLRERLFLGSEIRTTARIRAYRLKD